MWTHLKLFGTVIAATTEAVLISEGWLEYGEKFPYVYDVWIPKSLLDHCDQAKDLLGVSYEDSDDYMAPEDIEAWVPYWWLIKQDLVHRLIG